MGGWGSGRHGGRVTIEGCGSYRLSAKDLRQALRHPPGADQMLRYRLEDEPMDVHLEVRPAQGRLRLRHPSREVREFSSSPAPPAEVEYDVALTWTPAGFGAGAMHEIRRLKAALRRGARIYRCTRIKDIVSN